MSEMLLLPAPKTPKGMTSRQRWLVGIFLLISFIGMAIPSWVISQQHAAAKREALRISQEQQASEQRLQSLREQHESSLVRIMINQRDTDIIKLGDLLSDHQAADYQELLDQDKWQELITRLKSQIERGPIRPGLSWDPTQGWHLQTAQKEMLLDTQSIDLAQANLLNNLITFKNNLVLNINTRYTPMPVTDEELQQLVAAKGAIDQIIATPIMLRIGDMTKILDLNSDKKFLSLQGSSVRVNEDHVKSWLVKVAEEYYLPAPTLTITGKEEVRRGVFKAITIGEAQQGREIKVDEVFEQIIESLDQPTRDIEVRFHDIPFKVRSALEDKDYDLLAIGYSEYSLGNDANRVHNVKTGLGRVNGFLVDPEQKISFNQIVGEIDRDFRMGWGIFGSVALPVLGGGICQASTTFYRALLNLGIPITMRQNHSWDLEYYRKGGYGLDATIFPEKGVDVKATNDLKSQLYFHAYTKPETEEAFVYIYGQSDGRKVTLEPAEDYQPRPGAKTLKWKQTIEFPGGEIREHEILSRYRA